MDNLSDAIIMAGQVLMFMVAVSLGIIYYSNFQTTVGKMLTSSEKNSLNSEFYKTQQYFERYATKAEVINAILSMKKDIKREDFEKFEYDAANNVTKHYYLYEYYDTQFVPASVTVINKNGVKMEFRLKFSFDSREDDVEGHNYDAGLVMNNDIYEMEYYDLVNDNIDDGYYKIEYNASDNHNIHVTYSYVADNLEDAQGL